MSPFLFCICNIVRMQLQYAEVSFLGLLKYKVTIRRQKCASDGKRYGSKACLLHSNIASGFNLNFCRKNLKIVLT